MIGKRLKFRFSVLASLGAGIALFSLSSCFTGVESTPKINDSELRKTKSSKPSAEELFFENVRLPAASGWIPGRELIVTDPKIRLVLSVHPSGEPANLNPGDVIRFRRFAPAVSLTGDDASDIIFSADGYPELRHRVNVAVDVLSGAEAPVVEVPFTVDPALAMKADSILRSRPGNLWVLSPLWYDAVSGKAVPGYRHMAVKADSVRPGNHLFPLKVYFHVADERYKNTLVGEGEKLVFMADGTSSSGITRSFASLFSFEDPRRRYPSITPEVWDLIVDSRVRAGMTKEECRLALGSPIEVDLAPTRVGDIERWSYSDGVYLIFNPDGTLSSFRL